MIVFHDPSIGLEIAERAGVQFNPAVDVCIARVEGEDLYGGVIYNNYTGASINMHMAGFRPVWANPDMLWAAFHYPFVQLGCKKIFGQVPETNSKALEIDLKLGFKIITKIDDVFLDGGLYVLSLDRDDCRWLKIKPRGLTFGKEIL